MHTVKKSNNPKKDHSKTADPSLHHSPTFKIQDFWLSSSLYHHIYKYNADITASALIIFKYHLLIHEVRI